MLIEPKEYKIYQKEGHGNFVTQMDEKMQAHLVSELQKQYPQVGIIAEETQQFLLPILKKSNLFGVLFIILFKSCYGKLKKGKGLLKMENPSM